MNAVRHLFAPAAAAALLLAGGPRGVAAGDPPVAVPLSARQGLDLVRDAARAWQPDAALIYLENDEALDAGGYAGRWGYLFYSVAEDAARGYSVRNDKIVSADYLSFAFEAPPLSSEWIDSDAALSAAAKKAGDYRKEFGGRATTLLLMRGGFDDKKPDLTTWTVVYTADGAPSLFVVVDASNGKVKKVWRG